MSALLANFSSLLFAVEEMLLLAVVVVADDDVFGCFNEASNDFGVIVDVVVAIVVEFESLSLI